MTIERIREAIQLTRHTLEWCNQHPDEIKGQMKCLETILWALEKQIPKKPINIEKFDIYDIVMCVGECKCCGSVVSPKDYCEECGQRLDWGDEDDN